MLDNGSWTTIFMICGESLDPSEIEERMGFKPSAFVRSGEIEVPTVENGSSRWFDPRASLDCWKSFLSGRQYKRSLSEQLQYWHEKLSPAESALRHFNSVGHWTVIDCQAWGPPTLQFRLPTEVRNRMGRLTLDLEFAIFLAGEQREA